MSKDNPTENPLSGDHDPKELKFEAGANDYINRIKPTHEKLEKDLLGEEMLGSLWTMVNEGYVLLGEFMEFENNPLHLKLFELLKDADTTLGVSIKERLIIVLRTPAWDKEDINRINDLILSVANELIPRLVDNGQKNLANELVICLQATEAKCKVEALKLEEKK